MDTTEERPPLGCSHECVLVPHVRACDPTACDPPESPPCLTPMSAHTLSLLHHLIHLVQEPQRIFFNLLFLNTYKDLRASSSSYPHPLSGSVLIPFPIKSKTQQFSPGISQIHTWASASTPRGLIKEFFPLVLSFPVIKILCFSAMKVL